MQLQRASDRKAIFLKTAQAQCKNTPRVFFSALLQLQLAMSFYCRPRRNASTCSNSYRQGNNFSVSKSLGARRQLDFNHGRASPGGSRSSADFRRYI